MRMVEVVWRDCHSLADGWTSLAELDVHERLIRSCGYLAEDIKAGHIVLVQSIDEENVDHVIAIPVEVILSVTDLSVRMP